MKSLKCIINKYSYNEPNSNGWMPENNSFFQEDPYSYNQYTPSGMIEDGADKLRPSENRQRDGRDFEEFETFKKKDRIKKLRRLLRINKLKNRKQKKDVFTPAPFYSSMYGGTGFEGAMTSPLEYYSGGLSDEPGAITNNPYNSTYQGNSFASSRNERIKIRAMIFKDYIR